jgi:hypothetical protein
LKKYDFMKQNCWEYFKCGRQEGGDKVEEFGICPVYTEKKTNGINGGINAGRACWCVAGTFCEGKIQGTFAHIVVNCMKFDFYRLVLKEQTEEGDYTNPKDINDLLRT